MAEVQFWLSEGTIVGGRYRLDSVLGVGGYGITYKGIDTRLERLVAVKEYFPGFCASRFAQYSSDVRCQSGMEDEYDQGMERFLAEAKTLVQLSNVSGIVRVNDYFEENATAYLVMDYLDGKNLKQMSDGFGGRIPADILIPVLSPAIAALQQVHNLGMIHRDISPDNIMMLEDGSVRLIDFGNARDTTTNRSMTLAMKQGFAAPEQYRSKGQGTWTDVYGICATMYYCLTGKLPPQALERLTGTPFPKPSELGVAIQPHLEEAIMDGLELYVNKRIQTMDELWQRLYAQPQAVLPQPEETSALEEPAAEAKTDAYAPTTRLKYIDQPSGGQFIDQMTDGYVSQADSSYISQSVNGYVHPKANGTGQSAGSNYINQSVNGYVHPQTDGTGQPAGSSYINQSVNGYVHPQADATGQPAGGGYLDPKTDGQAGQLTDHRHIDPGTGGYTDPLAGSSSDVQLDKVLLAGLHRIRSICSQIYQKMKEL